jgi:hypothetical protein
LFSACSPQEALHIKRADPTHLLPGLSGEDLIFCQQFFSLLLASLLAGRRPSVQLVLSSGEYTPSDLFTEISKSEEVHLWMIKDGL